MGDEGTHYIRLASSGAYPTRTPSSFPPSLPRLFFAIHSLAQPSLSLGIKTLHIYVPPHHRVQPRTDGGIEEAGAQGRYIQARVDGTEAGPRTVASLECGFGLGASLRGEAFACGIGELRWVRDEYIWGGRGAFRTYLE